MKPSGFMRDAGGCFSTLVSGSYVEAGDRGRVRVRAGDVVLHGLYESPLANLPWRISPDESHLDSFARTTGY